MKKNKTPGKEIDNDSLERLIVQKETELQESLSTLRKSKQPSFKKHQITTEDNIQIANILTRFGVKFEVSLTKNILNEDSLIDKLIANITSTMNFINK